MAYSPMMQAALGLTASNPLPAGYNYKAGGSANFGGVNFSDLLNKYNQDKALPAYNGDGEAGLSAMQARQSMNFGNGQNGQSSWGYGGYDVIPLPNGGYGLAKGTSGAQNGTGYGIFGEQPMDVYDSSGKFIGTGQTPKGLNPNDESLKQFGIGAAFMAPMWLAATGALGAGAGASSGTGTGAGVTGFGDAGTMYAGADAASAGTLGGGASVLGGQALPAAGAAGGLGTVVSGQSLGGASTAGGLQGSALGNAAGVGSVSPVMGGGAASGLGSILSNIGKTATGGLGDILSKLGSSGLGPLVSGGVDAYQQGQAADKMLEWMNGQQAKVDNLYSPGSAEYNALWDQMSRKDAAAGRNSQYGPRSVDLAAKIAQIKADDTARMTIGMAPAYSNALNKNASKYAGLGSAFGNMDLGGLSSLFGGSGNDLGALADWYNGNSWDNFDIGSWFA